MARKRYLSTNTANDRRLAELAARAGPWAVLLYTWSIPHAGDDATLHGDPEELLSEVMPLLAMRDLVTVADVEKFIGAAVKLKLLERTGTGRLRFPPQTFYSYQNYITEERRNGPSANPRKSAQNPADPRESPQNPADLENAPDPAQNPASFKSSSSSSFNHSAGGSVQRAPARARGQLDEKKTNDDEETTIRAGPTPPVPPPSTNSDVRRTDPEPESRCPMGPHTFTGSYSDHLASDPRHRVGKPAQVEASSA